MKHALIINHNAGSPYHGPNFRSYYAGLEWVKNGIRATIVCSSFSHKLKKLPRVEGDYSIEWIDGIRYIWLKTPPFSGNAGRLMNFIHFQRRLFMLDKIIKEPVDYVVCSSPPPFWIWFCRRFAARKEASLIFEARDLWPDVIFETTRLGLFNPAAWCMRIAEIDAYKHSDAVVSVNESAVKIMQKRGLPRSRFWPIPNGVSVEADAGKDTAPESAVFCQKLREDGFFVVGYAGALSRIYALAYLAEAARVLRHEKIAFVLAGTGEYENELSRIAETLPNLHLAGWIPKKQLNSFLKSVDICFAGLLNVPSFAFGSDSTKIYEYMKAARPVLHSIGNKDSVVARAGCGVRVPPEDAGEVVSGIRYLAAMDRGELEKMGERGLDFLRKNRSYEVLTEKWLRLFRAMDKKKSGTLQN